MGALAKLVVAAFKGLLAKIAAAGLLVLEMLGRVFTGADGAIDDAVRAAALLLSKSDPAREWLVRWLQVLAQAIGPYWVILGVLAGLAVVLTAAGHLPLMWRAASAWRRAVFVSFQNEREGEARGVAEALGGGRFRVLRVPYAPGAGHQQIVASVNELLRRCDAVVCLPGRDASFVEAEVAAATVAHKPVVFLVAERGTLPNTADKRHPAFSQERVAACNYGPVADFLHHVTQDFRSTRQLYRAAWGHPAVAVGFVRLFAAAGSAALLLFVVALVHGERATAAVAEVPPEFALLRWEAILMVCVPLLLGAMLVLPATIWLAIVVRALWGQLRAARRAALRVRSGEFARDDWADIVPGMRPGQPLYEALRATAPMAHHERAASE